MDEFPIPKSMLTGRYGVIGSRPIVSIKKDFE